ncbi:hypothetical protein D3C74_325530 [compost metagenome]
MVRCDGHVHRSQRQRKHKGNIPEEPKRCANRPAAVIIVGRGEELEYRRGSHDHRRALVHNDDHPAFVQLGNGDVGTLRSQEQREDRGWEILNQLQQHATVENPTVFDALNPF